MSEIKENIIIEPGKYLKCAYPERFETKVYECERCGGKGYHMPYPTGYKTYDQDECETCKGTGRLQAEVTIKWATVGDKRKKLGE